MSERTARCRFVGAVMRRSAKRRLPSVLHRAAGILARFGLFTEIAQHRIDASLQGNVAVANRRLHSPPFSVVPKPLKLFVRVKNQRRPGKPPRQSRASAVESNDVKSLAGEAEGEARIGRIGGDAFVPLVMRRDVDFMELLQLPPEPPLEVPFA